MSLQHYSRPGDPRKQETKTYPNGSTLTFGKEVKSPIASVYGLEMLINIPGHCKHVQCR